MKSSILLLSILIGSFLVLANASVLEESCKNLHDPKHYAYCMKMLSGTDKDSQISLATTANSITIQKFKEVKHKIDQLKKKDGLSSMQKMCLRICDNSYRTGILKLERVNHNFVRGGFKAATIYLTGALDKTTSCILSFEKAGIASMLPDENDDVMNSIRVTDRLMETAKFEN